MSTSASRSTGRGMTQWWGAAPAMVGNAPNSNTTPRLLTTPGEVPKRLEQCYNTAPLDTPVRIEIPLGSYTPEYHWASPPIPVAESLSLEVPGVQNTDSADMEVTTPHRRRLSGLKMWSVLTGLLFAVGAMFTVAWGME